MRLDLHVHSRYSDDARPDVATILRVAKSRGLDGVAVTDHNTMAGSLEAIRLNQDPHFLVIPGAEYASDRGHILAYFLDHEPDLAHVPVGSRGLRQWRQLIDAIHSAGGLAFLAHPYKRSRHIEPDVWGAIDGVEVFNSRACWGKNPHANQDAAEAARKYGLAVSAGSDAHWPGEIGKAVIQFPPVPDKSLSAVTHLLSSGTGRVSSVRSSPLYEPASQLLKVMHMRYYRYLPRVLAKLAVVLIKEAFYLLDFPGKKGPLRK